MGPDHGAVQQKVFQVRIIGKGLLHPLPDALLTPAEKAFIHGVPSALLPAGAPRHWAPVRDIHTIPVRKRRQFSAFPTYTPEQVRKN